MALDHLVDGVDMHLCGGSFRHDKLLVGLICVSWITGFSK